MVNAFYQISLLLLTLNIMNGLGWVFLPTPLIVIPTIIIAVIWIWLLVVATAITIDDFKKNR
jgi:hypothetical protein